MKAGRLMRAATGATSAAAGRRAGDRAADQPTILEIGTSYGYSGIWLAEAARATGGRVFTLELQDYKSAYAREMATQAGLAAHIDFRVGDAVDLIGALPRGIDFVLLDLWKDLYVPCLEASIPGSVPARSWSPTT